MRTQHHKIWDDLLNTLVASSNAPVILLSQQLKILDINIAAESYYDLEKNSVLGEKYSVFYKKFGASPIVSNINNIPTDKVFLKQQIKNKIKTDYWKAYPFKNEKGIITFILLIGEHTFDQNELSNIYDNRAAMYLDSLISQIPQYVYWKNQDFTYLGCNNQLAQIAGLACKEDIAGKTDHDFGWKKKRISQLRKTDEAVIKQGIDTAEEEIIPIPHTNEKRVMITHKKPLRDESGKIIGLLGISTDITDRKKMEIELKAAKEKAEEFNALKSKFIQNMEHDIRTPAAGLEQTLSILLSKETDSFKKEVIQFSLSAAEELKILLNSILNFDRLKYDNPLLEAPVKLSSIFHSIYMLNWPTANVQQLKFHYKIDGNIPSIVISDEHRIKHILLNLVGNALKFTKTGEVFFEARLINKKGRNLLIEFTVKDTGIGIPENKRNVIFERFVRLDDSNRGIYKGTGLGLANVKDYVEQLGGEFKPIQSTEGMGTTFAILIPMKASLDQQMELSSNSAKSKEEIEFFKEPTAKPPQKKSLKKEKRKVQSPAKKTTSMPAKNKRAHALLVEDSLLAQRMTQSVLSELDCDLDIPGTAEEALKLISKNEYDLIFADIGLPGMDGIEMTRHIRYEERKKAARPLPIIGQSAQADATNKKACIGAGMQDLLPKPLTKRVATELLNNYVPQYAEEHPSAIKFAKKRIYHKQVIDRELFKDIIRNNPGTIKNFIVLTQEMLETDVLDFEKAYQNKNWKDLLFLTHKLRGGFACIAAMRLEETCGHLEEYLREYKDQRPNLVLVKALHDIILDEIKKLKTELKKDAFNNHKKS